jgi:hypothetical protein
MNEKGFGFAVKRGVVWVSRQLGGVGAEEPTRSKSSASRIEHSLVLAASIPWPCPFNLSRSRWSRCGARDLAGLSLQPLSMDFAVLLRDVAMGDDGT